MINEVVVGSGELHARDGIRWEQLPVGGVHGPDFHVNDRAAEQEIGDDR